MRQFRHKLVGGCFWILLVALWVVLVREGKAGPGSLADSALYVGAIACLVLAVTLWWIRHNMGIYRRKGPRRGRPENPPRTDEDRLERPIRWELDGGAAAALTAGHLVVELDGPAKVYRPAEE